MGTAILSRWPLVDHDVRALEGAEMPALHAVVDTPTGGLPVIHGPLGFGAGCVIPEVTCSSECRRRRGCVVGVRRFGTAPVDGIWASDHFGVLAHIAAAGPA